MIEAAFGLRFEMQDVGVTGVPAGLTEDRPGTEAEVHVLVAIAEGLVEPTEGVEQIPTDRHARARDGGDRTGLGFFESVVGLEQSLGGPSQENACVLQLPVGVRES